MDQPINTNSESVEALLARLRQAQERTTQQTGPAQNGNHYQYQQSIQPYQQPHYPGNLQDFSSSIATPTSGHGPSFAQPYAQQHQYEQSGTFYNDRLQYQQHYEPPLSQHDHQPASSVDSLLASLQSSRQGGYPNFGPPIPPLSQPQYGFTQPDIGYHPNPSGWNRSKYAPQQQQQRQQRQANGHNDRNSVNPNLSAKSTASGANSEPITRRIQPSASPNGLLKEPEKQQSPSMHTREPVVEFTREVAKIATLPSPVAPIVSAPARPANYDPYDEDYERPPVQVDSLQMHDEQPSEVDDNISEEEAEAAKKSEEEEQAKVVAQRNMDEFVNLSYGQALPIISRLLNEETVMRRLKELKEEQDKMERQLWEKRLEIVKVYRERMEKAKEDATRQDVKTGNTLIQKERSAASRALKQYYITRCLPHFDDLHRKHLKIMQEELGIPGLGRLETRRKIPVTMSGRAEKPISIDSDDDDDAEGENKDEKAKPGDVELAEEEKQKMLARRRKIMSVIESVMSDT
ncbi:hypothetical protein QFC24_001227 [Naganishia onofrii]|uniref:Uncharacterized protein n=1 Tax=Naganishia onofrii TaxID=1851511 RepID=A0ACC2XTM9_9TREE|nr:hypothetical protein QFC24_001227 [Naganishia onofrii]